MPLADAGGADKLIALLALFRLLDDLQAYRATEILVQVGRGLLAGKMLVGFNLCSAEGLLEFGDFFSGRLKLLLRYWMSFNHKLIAFFLSSD